VARAPQAVGKIDAREAVRSAERASRESDDLISNPFTSPTLHTNKKKPGLLAWS
jgi:hypothetical protein